MSTQGPSSEEEAIKRRTVLKGMGASAGVLGLASASLPAGATPGDGSFDLYTITPSSDRPLGEAAQFGSSWSGIFGSYGIGNQKILTLDDQGGLKAQNTLNPENIANPSETVIQVATLSLNPAAVDAGDKYTLYGIANQRGGDTDNLTRTDTDQTGRFVFKLDPTTGDLRLIGGPNNTLQLMYGSTFNTDGSKYYGQTGEDDNRVWQIFVDESSNTTTVNELGNLENVSELNLTEGDISHTGQSWNKLAPSNQIVSIIGDFTGAEGDDLIDIDPDASPLGASLIASGVFASGELVCTAFNPCEDGDPERQRVYAIRNGNDFQTADVSGGSFGGASAETQLTFDGDDILMVTDNLAEDVQPCAIACTRTIGYWKNHPGCGGGPGNGKGNSNKDTVESVLEECGGFVVGTAEDCIYDGTAGTHPDATYDFRESTGGEGWPCDGDVSLIVDALDGANAKDMDDQLLAQLLGAKLNVCNGATTSTGGGSIVTTIDYVDRYFAATVSSECGDVDTVIQDYIDFADLAEDTTNRRVKEIWKDALDGYNNQNIALTCE